MTEDARAEEQANIPPKSGFLSIKLIALTILVGVAAGIGGMVMMWVLRNVQHLALDYHAGEFSSAAARTSAIRLITVLAIGGLVTGVGLWLMRNHGGTGGEPTKVVWEKSGKLSLVRSYLSGALSEVTVGMGASLGREAAPQRSGAAAGDAIARKFSLPDQQRFLLIACGAGAGVAAVYNAPFAGALFALEVYLGTFSLVLAIPALLASAIATWVSWIGLSNHAVYSISVLPSPSLSLMCFAIVIGPVIGLLSSGYVKLIGWASEHQPKGYLLVVEPIVVFGLLGLVAIRYPLLLGNGLDLAQFAFVGVGGVLVMFALTLLKPISTAACLRSGASGGLLTPTLSFGAILGAFAGHLWGLFWPGSPMTSYAIIAAAAMLGAAAQGPFMGVIFVLELTQNATAELAPMLIAVGGATLVARRFDLRSIYTARLALRPSNISGESSS